jgi:invasion protein IalB
MPFPLYLVACAGLAFGLLLSAAEAQTPTPLPEAPLDQAVAPETPLDLSVEPEAPDTPQPDWVVTCTPATDPAKSVCQMVQVLYVEETGQPMVSVTIRPQAEDRHMGMLLALPHGLYFPPGLTITVDHGEATYVEIQTSDKNGAYAAVPLTEEFIQAMKLGRDLNISMRFADGRDEVVPLTLNGFTAAYSKLTSLL